MIVSIYIYIGIVWEFQLLYILSTLDAVYPFNFSRLIFYVSFFLPTDSSTQTCLDIVYGRNQYEYYCCYLILTAQVYINSHMPSVGLRFCKHIFPAGFASLGGKQLPVQCHSGPVTKRCSMKEKGVTDEQGRKTQWPKLTCSIAGDKWHDDDKDDDDGGSNCLSITT